MPPGLSTSSWLPCPTETLCSAGWKCPGLYVFCRSVRMMSVKAGSCSALVWSWHSKCQSSTLRAPSHLLPFRLGRKETLTAPVPQLPRQLLSFSQLYLALLQVFLGSSEALSSLLCKWGNEAFLSPDWLSLEDSQSLLKLRFSGAALKVPGVKLPSVPHIQRISCLVYLMCLSQR